jgi:hypothetical protein
MGVAAGSYTKALRERFGYSATWVPNTRVELGDVGLLQGNVYERVGSLDDFGLSFTTRESRARGVFEFTSSGSVTFGVKASGEPGTPLSALAVADAGLTVDFTSAESTVFQAAGCTVIEINDQHRVGEQLLELHEEGRWPDGYVIITEVIRAERATVLVASTSGARMEFTANVDVRLGPLSLVDAHAGLALVRSQGMGLQIVAEGELTPLFRAKGIRKRFLRGSEFRTRGPLPAGAPTLPGSSAPPTPDAQDVFDEVDYVDFESS